MRMTSAESFRGLTLVYRRWERWIQSLAVLAGPGHAGGTVAAARDSLKPAPGGIPGRFPPEPAGQCGNGGAGAGLLSVCALSLTLVPIFVALVATVAETIGEISGYAVGYGGRRVIEGRGFYARVAGWMERRGVLVIFVISIVPNPFFDVIGIAAGGPSLPAAPVSRHRLRGQDHQEHGSRVRLRSGSRLDSLAGASGDPPR